MKKLAPQDEAQLKRFKEASRNLGADQSEAAFDRVLRKVGGAPPTPLRKPKPSKPTPRSR
jgi:hypothetical protein